MVVSYIASFGGEIRTEIMAIDLGNGLPSVGIQEFLEKRYVCKSSLGGFFKSFSTSQEIAKCSPSTRTCISEQVCSADFILNLGRKCFKIR